MQKNSSLLKNTLIMTAVNLIMKSAGVGFNSFLTQKIGSDGMGLFQLVMSVYSLAVTFSCAGIRLASTRITVEIKSLRKNDIRKTIALCIIYAGICGCIIGFILIVFADFISIKFISNSATALPLRILAPSLPFVAMSSALGGYFTATGQITQFSIIQMTEQAFKIFTTVWLIKQFCSAEKSVTGIVIGMTLSEMFSFSLSFILEKSTAESKSPLPPANVISMLRIALPDATGTIIRNILLTVEHLIIPKGFEKSGVNQKESLASYGCIHSMAMPVLLYPSAVLSSLSSLLIPDLAEKREKGNQKAIDETVNKNLKLTAIFSLIVSAITFIFSPSLCQNIYKSKEAVRYTKILSPLVPIMYLDMITDGMLKGLDQQIYSMRYNIIDSSICVILVYLLLPKYAVKGYIAILYLSEIINFYLSFGRLCEICEIRFLRAPSKDISRLFRLKKCSVFQPKCEYQTYPGQKKRSQAP